MAGGLEDYIKRCIESGLTRGQIEQRLVTAGWKRQDYADTLDIYFGSSSRLPTRKSPVQETPANLRADTATLPSAITSGSLETSKQEKELANLVIENFKRALLCRREVYDEESSKGTYTRALLYFAAELIFVVFSFVLLFLAMVTTMFILPTVSASLGGGRPGSPDASSLLLMTLLMSIMMFVQLAFFIAQYSALVIVRTAILGFCSFFIARIMGGKGALDRHLSTYLLGQSSMNVVLLATLEAYVVLFMVFVTIRVSFPREALFVLFLALPLLIGAILVGHYFRMKAIAVDAVHKIGFLKSFVAANVIEILFILFWIFVTVVVFQNALKAMVSAALGG